MDPSLAANDWTAGIGCSLETAMASCAESHSWSTSSMGAETGQAVLGSGSDVCGLRALDLIMMRARGVNTPTPQ